LAARKEKNRKMAAHIAATVGLLGALAGLGRGLPKLFGGSKESATIASVLMGALCTIYVIACVQSFIAVRKARGKG
jgi:nitrate/nitrite transporter NarK